MPIKKEFIAHVKMEEDKWVIHDLADHLTSVAKLAASFAIIFNAKDWAYLAGLWHDLGKYQLLFQERISLKSGCDENAHLENEFVFAENEKKVIPRVDHSTAGAIHAIDKMGDAIGRVLAYLIAGHHTGLPDWNYVHQVKPNRQGVLEERLKQKNLLSDALSSPIPEAIMTTSFPTTNLGLVDNLHVRIRMLFSCLVDADFIDTELFMNKNNALLRQGYRRIDELKSVFDSYIDNKIASVSKSVLNDIRASIFNQCIEAAKRASPIFTLTVPTGGGKTLSSMGFALNHAVHYKKQRVIVVIPYTSIIEETAQQYRDIFGEDIIEHHSNIDVEVETSRSRLSSENWDAPIIVTTNVMFFESLFASKPSRCRKLHNIVNSVVIIDEAQLLSPSYLQVMVDMIRVLSEDYGVTFVLSTATQPALNTRYEFGDRVSFKGLDNTDEIIENVPDLYKVLKRVDIHKPPSFTDRVSWEALADELSSIPCVLVIVNTKKDARDLLKLMPEGTFHLSTLMCGAHRSAVLKMIKQRLKEGISIRVVSTQLVEAGVNLDFPVVYRALSGLDSIVQAAGRCNREGKLDKGIVKVFMPPSASPKGLLLKAEQATIATAHLWRDNEVLDNTLFKTYFSHFFESASQEKSDALKRLLSNSYEVKIPFQTIASTFQLIEDNQKSIIIPYDKKITSIIGKIKAEGINRFFLRMLQRYTVSVYDKTFNTLLKNKKIEDISEGLYVLSSMIDYDERLGLLDEDSVLLIF